MLIDGVKFACEPCIRGHRQATCAHTDRPLREIARRGRPVTACAACREMRKTNNAHRTCHHDKTESSEPLLKTLPNGISDLHTVSLVRRPSSTRSRSSVSSAAPSPAPGAQRTAGPSSCAASAASASDQELATVGRKKSLSRPASVSRRSSSARDKKPHDLAHGHLADHPTHVSAVYSPYPQQHGAKEHHHSHHHLPPGPSPLSKGAELQRKVKVEGQPAVPPLPSSSTLHLPRLPSLAPTPPRSNSAPTPYHADAPSTSSSSSPAPPHPSLAAPRPSAPLTTEQLASAYFFRDLPPKTEAFVVSPAGTATSSTAPDPAMQAYFEAPILGGPSPEDAGGNGDARYSPYGSATGAREMPMVDEPPSFAAASPAPSLPPLPDLIDPAAAAFVLGDAATRPAVALAPMFGEGENDAIFRELEQQQQQQQVAPPFSSINDGQLYSFAPVQAQPPPSSSLGVAGPSIDAWASQDYPPPSSSAASSDVFDLHHQHQHQHQQGDRRPSSALYGYPLEPVASHTLSSYSSASASGAQSLSATSALERLDLDLDFDQLDHRAAAGAASYLSSASHSAQTTPPHAPFDAQQQQQQATDLDGILEWLASASAGPPPLQHTDSSASGASSSGVQSAWPSAPPSVYGGASGQDDDDESGAASSSRMAHPLSSQDDSPPAPGAAGRVAFGELPRAYSYNSSAHEHELALPRPGSGLAHFASASGEEEDEDDDERRERRGDNDLEMLRTATITCCDPSASASASHSSDEGGGGGGAWAEGGGAGRGAAEEPFSLADLDLERFGVDEAWLRSLGLFGAAPEGEGDEDDGYEEDDEASVRGGEREPVWGARRGGPDHDEDDEEDHRGWTEDDFAWPPAMPDRAPSPTPEAPQQQLAVEVKDEQLSGDDFAAAGPGAKGAGPVKDEDVEGERDRDEEGLNRGELWWS
ncbi:hypothetical protein JCM8208_007323 [Rhodotorula glutinis]